MALTGRRLLVALTMALLTTTGVTGCDASSDSVSEHSRQVTVVGSGEVQGVPDLLTADVAIEFAAPDVTTATNQTNDRQRAVIDALTSRGIDGKDINTTQVSLQPEYGDNSTISGYRATNAIQVKIRKLDSASQALTSIVDAGGNATRINSVSYSIEDNSKLVTDARARAFQDAQDRAKQYAQLSGLTLGKVISISEAPGSTPPVPAVPMPRGAMATEMPLQPGEQTVGFTVTAVWELT
jgi:uncharacterized protein YggE